MIKHLTKYFVKEAEAKQKVIVHREGADYYIVSPFVAAKVLRPIYDRMRAESGLFPDIAEGDTISATVCDTGELIFVPKSMGSLKSTFDTSEYKQEGILLPVTLFEKSRELMLFKTDNDIVCLNAKIFKAVGLKRKDTPAVMVKNKLSPVLCEFSDAGKGIYGVEIYICPTKPLTNEPFIELLANSDCFSL